MQYQSYRNYTSNSRLPARRKRRVFRKAIILLLLIVVAGGVTVYSLSSRHSAVASRVAGAQSTTSTKPAATPAQASPKPNVCTSNTVAQNIIVSISKRHLWACAATTQAYDSAVVTGMENLPADLTPTGIYHIYGKQTDLNLKGSDSTGSWNDHVYYWMPFLDNQYGAYGFHDATWRAPNDFGNIDPYSTNASHGCVELPLATAKWLYNWAPIGTQVTIES